MENLPKIVQARLPRKGTHAAEMHPDADLLTAFAEKSISESERAQVMEHLSLCGDCREVVALALPTMEAVSVPERVRAARPWLSWPALRWGFVSAGIVLVTSVGVLEYRQRTQQNAAVAHSSVEQSDRSVAPLPGAVTREATPQAGEKPREIPMRKLAHAENAVAENRPSASPNAPSVGKAYRLGVAPSAGAADRADLLRQNDQGSHLATTSPTTESPAAPNPGTIGAQGVVVPQVSEMVEVQAESAPAATKNQRQLAKNRPGLPPQSGSFNQSKATRNSDVVRAKDSVASQVPSGAVATPRWAISPAGGLQRSFDAGMTWEEVKVSRAVLAAGSLTQNGASYKDQYAMKLKKSSKQEQANAALVFRAVAATGAEVWAGGSDAMLCHSLDSGNHWTQIVPSEENFSLTGDIVSLEFSDIQHGKVVTSSGEAWMTSDDGQTWRKQ